MVEKNDKGQFLLNPTEAAEEVVEKYSRYNGGWVKRVTGLNKSVTDGYSILGDFVPDKIVWTDPGLYIDCSIDGTRKRHERRFTLFMIKPDGSAEEVSQTLLMQGAQGGDWAPRMWHDIEKQLEVVKGWAQTDPTAEYVKVIREAFFKLKKFGLVMDNEFRTRYEFKGVTKELRISITELEDDDEPREVTEPVFDYTDRD